MGSLSFAVGALLATTGSRITRKEKLLNSLSIDSGDE